MKLPRNIVSRILGKYIVAKTHSGNNVSRKLHFLFSSLDQNGKRSSLFAKDYKSFSIPFRIVDVENLGAIGRLLDAMVRTSVRIGLARDVLRTRTEEG